MELDQLQRKLGVKFKQPHLLEVALTHPSYTNEHLNEGRESNQRMEFLGDACIGLTVATELYHRYPEVDEGLLTERRSRIVRGDALAGVARRLDLGRHLLLGQGELAGGGRDRLSNLAAALEAVAGALLLDGGYARAEKFVLRILNPELVAVDTEGDARDAKSLLQEKIQGERKLSASYQVIAIEGEAHSLRFTVHVMVDGQVLGTGQGNRKSEAEQQAAAAALERLE
jgi:ribonuclease-3